MVKLILRATVLCSLAAVAFSCAKIQRPDSAVLETRDVPKSFEVILTYPDCIPGCTMADKNRYLEEGRVENLLVEAIDAASRTIEFSQFTFSRKPVLAALVRAATRGVVVRGLVDKGQFRTLGYECAANDSNCLPKLPPAFTEAEYLANTPQERLELVLANRPYGKASNSEILAMVLNGTAGPAGVRTLPGKRRLVHHKYLLIDDKKLINGSGNWSSTAVSVNLENLTIVTRPTGDPDEASSDATRIVTAFKTAFNLLWSAARVDADRQMACLQVLDLVYFRPLGGKCRAFNDDPELRLRPQTILDALVKQIDETGETVDIAMHHLTHSSVYAALMRARERNVEVRVLLDVEECNKPTAAERLQKLVNAKGRLRYMPTNCKIAQLAHNKFGIFDGKVVINGSGNWSKSGLGKNYENFLVLGSVAQIVHFVEFFERAWNAAVERGVCLCGDEDSACRGRYCLQ